jgi:SAM-dependent methyltransferase
MPTVTENKRLWDQDFAWTQRGDEWSDSWGGPSMQWYGSILPRIHRFVPTGRILEIACGFGRWTQFLKDSCQALTVVDLAEECIAACRERFVSSTNIEYHVNDGTSLSMIPDGSVDFVFSYDSLVHADRSVLAAYLAQLPRILAEGGGAFIHHSNLGAYRRTASLVRRARRVPRLEGALARLRIIERTHLRDTSVSATIVEEVARQNGLECVSQEIIPWGTRRTEIDCFTTLLARRAAGDDGNRVMHNPNFMDEARNLARLSRLYVRPSDERR